MYAAGKPYRAFFAVNAEVPRKVQMPPFNDIANWMYTYSLVKEKAMHTYAPTISRSRSYWLLHTTACVDTT